MTTQNILCIVSISLTVLCTVLFMYNIKTARFQFIKNNTVAAFIAFIPLIIVAVFMIFVENNGGLEYVLCLLSGFGFPCIMIVLVAVFEKMIATDKKFKEIDQNGKDKSE